MLRIRSLIGNSQRLDGGAMFGNAPRSLWKKWCPPDEAGRIALSCRSFLVEDAGRRIVIDTGVGAFFDPRLRKRYGVQESNHVLLDSLGRHDLEAADVDVVLFSHLHFDHAGGVLAAYSEGKALELAFPRAEFLVGEMALSRASNPHPRDRASFIPGLGALLESSGRLKVVKRGETQHPALGNRIELWESNGHTPGMLIPTMKGVDAQATYCADLVPGVPWVHLPMSMGYDRYPESLVDEKQALYEKLDTGSWLLFPHDTKIAAGRLGRDENGRYLVEELREELKGWDLDS